MNIAIFTNNYFPNPYGVTGSIESFRKQFEKRGHQVFIFAPRAKGYRDENPNVFRYPSVDIKYKISFPLAIPYSKKLDKIIADLDLDIIHSQHPNLLGSAAAKWARKKNIPLVFTWHTLYDRYVHFVPLIPPGIATKWIINKAVDYANKCDQVIIPTGSIERIIREWGVKNENIAEIPTGVEEAFYQNPDGKLIREKYGIREKEILLLLVSRLTQEKNIEFLFRSAIRVLKSMSNVKFLVAGDGHLVPALKEAVAKNNVQDKVIFAGIMDREGLKNYYAAGDIFIYASKSETQGMIISEAMCLGLPVVAVRATGIQDLVQDNANGFLVSENEEEFAEAVKKLVENTELRENFAKISKSIAEKKYTSKVCADKMLEIYNSLIKK